jgi:hypothetical protein
MDRAFRCLSLSGLYGLYGLYGLCGLCGLYGPLSCCLLSRIVQPFGVRGSSPTSTALLGLERVSV